MYQGIEIQNITVLYVSEHTEIQNVTVLYVSEHTEIQLN